MSSTTRNIALFYHQSCVYGIFEGRGKWPVLVELPHLQDVRAASDRWTCCVSTKPLTLSQTSTHVSTKCRTWGLRLANRKKQNKQVKSLQQSASRSVQYGCECQYLYPGEVMPATVSEVGRGDVRILFP